MSLVTIHPKRIRWMKNPWDVVSGFKHDNRLKCHRGIVSQWTFQLGLNVTVDETWVDVTSRHRGVVYGRSPRAGVPGYMNQNIRTLRYLLPGFRYSVCLHSTYDWVSGIFTTVPHVTYSSGQCTFLLKLIK